MSAKTGEWENVSYQWIANGQCSRRGCCSFRHGSARGQRAQSSSLAPRAQTQSEGRKLSKACKKSSKELIPINHVIIGCGTDCQRRGAHQRGSTSVRSRLKSVRDSPIPRRNVYSSITWKTLRRPRIISSLLSFQGYTPIWEVFRPLHRHQKTRQEEKRKKKWPLETVGHPLQVHLGGTHSH